MTSASPYEATLVETTRDCAHASQLLNRFTGNRAYDSDGLYKRLREEREIELIAPHRADRGKPATQDG
jgi:hypothetical protein